MRKKYKTRLKFVEFKCLTCGQRKKIHPNEMKKREQISCDVCYSPMITIKAKSIIKGNNHV